MMFKRKSFIDSRFLTGFSLIELLVVTGIIVILVALAVPNLHDFQLTNDLENSAEELINSFRLAQQNTIASEGSSSWGIYLSTSTTPHQYTIFKGQSYSLRQVQYDEIHNIAGSVLISAIELEGGSEVIFRKVSGVSNVQGWIGLVLKSDPTKTKTVYIEQSGQVGLINPVPPSDLNRIKDSRHLHFDYSRYISTSSEDLVLTFFYDATSQVEVISIADNMQVGQILWQGEIEVDGEIQKLEIKTHRFNDPLSGTEFSIHRDRRYSTKPLEITLDDSPDPDTGNLIEYSADGSTTITTSVYVSNIQWQ